MTERQPPFSPRGSSLAGIDDARASKVNVMLVMDRLGYDDLHFHGAGRLMMEWTRALVESGVEVVTVILRHPGELGRRVLAEGLPFLFLSRRRYDPRTLLDMLRIMRRHRIQVVHLQGFGSSAFGRIAARVLGIPVIVHVHADHRFESLGYPWFVRWADRLLAPGTSQVLAVSDFARDFAIGQQGFPAESVEVLYNPVDLRHFRPASPAERDASRRALGLDPSDRVAVCVTRFHPVKGIDVLVEAWAEVGARFADARLLLVGEGPLRAELEGQVALTCPPGSVQFIGYRDDVKEVLAAADFAIMPSRAEGFSVAALEILGSGLPLVATRVGGNSRLVADGVNGLLVAADDPAGLARALARLLEDERLVERLADRARESVLHYDLVPFAHRLRERYEALTRAGIT